MGAYSHTRRSLGVGSHCVGPWVQQYQDQHLSNSFRLSLVVTRCCFSSSHHISIQSRTKTKWKRGKTSSLLASFYWRQKPSQKPSQQGFLRSHCPKLDTLPLKHNLSSVGKEEDSRSSRVAQTCRINHLCFQGVNDGFAGTRHMQRCLSNHEN